MARFTANRSRANAVTRWPSGTMSATSAPPVGQVQNEKELGEAGNPVDERPADQDPRGRGELPDVPAEGSMRGNLAHPWRLTNRREPRKRFSCDVARGPQGVRGGPVRGTYTSRDPERLT